MIELESRPSVESSGSGDGVHIEDEAENAPEALVHAMLCGEQVVIFDDGRTAPEGFDFYGEGAGHKATCKRCLEVHRARSSA
jgi:hypothetical protein